MNCQLRRSEPSKPVLLFRMQRDERRRKTLMKQKVTFKPENSPSHFKRASYYLKQLRDKGDYRYALQSLGMCSNLAGLRHDRCESHDHQIGETSSKELMRRKGGWEQRIEVIVDDRNRNDLDRRYLANGSGQSTAPASIVPYSSRSRATTQHVAKRAIYTRPVRMTSVRLWMSV
ncbi:hypothetical protein Y032_0336g2887 [Ancylostoma ceylanicum]|uniref:Uncharacterized protein n=1 Tax=Ancylostoma ceylanicum TaxID=53326 RepID=A0A016RYG2_9BILA|nr:hypothetical protein Y032_0336g2887 [Ancylostoma ceylanicum]